MKQIPTPPPEPVKVPDWATRKKLKFGWACDNFKVSEDDPAFCANCGDFASMHKGPTPGAPRQFRL